MWLREKVIVKVWDGDYSVGCDGALIVAETKIEDVCSVLPCGGDGAAGDGDSSKWQSKVHEPTFLFHHLLFEKFLQ